MARATLMVFILDNIPGFSEMLNVTFDVLQKSNPGESYTQSHFCDPTVAEPILHIVDNQLHDHDIQRTDDLINRLEDTGDDSKLNSMSFQISNEREDPETNIASDNDTFTKNLNRLLSLNPKDLVSQTLHRKFNISTTIVVPKKGKFPKSAPFLVAIFESLSNVTAQTCAGVLLSPVWVLTTANCIDVLEDLDVNTNKTSKSSYMVVAGARNPFKDGSIHNVTAMYVYPDKSSSYPEDGRKAAKEKEKLKETIVLMKLGTPATNITPVKMAGEQVVDHANVEVWGWSSLNVTQSQNRTTVTETHATWRLGTVWTCDLNLTASGTASEPALEPALCLTVAALNNTLSNGAPILVLEEGEPRLLALVYETPGSLVQPLSRYATWIEQLTFDRYSWRS